VSRRTDVYALGATLYKLLTGEPVFIGKDAIECMRRTVEEDPLPLRRLVPEIPADLETIVMKCLEKEPGQRYESARALSEDLRRFRDGEPILAHPPTLLYRIGKRAKKHRTLVMVSGAALLVILVFAGIGIQARMTASARAQWAQHFGQQAEQIESLIRYTHLLPIHDVRPELAQVREQLQSMERDAAKSGNAAAGPAAYALGRGYLALGEPLRAKESLGKAWGLGFRSPEVSYALGRALGALYQQELERARRIAEPDVREAKVREIEQMYRDPALAKLRAGSGTSLEPASYRDALLAFYDQRYDEALIKTREAFRARPWFYEALRLEGDILLAQAGSRTEPKEIRDLLEAATQRFQSAQRVAPSDATLHLGEARCYRQELEQDSWHGEFPLDVLDAGLDACAQARKINPDLPDVYSIDAWLHIALVGHRSSKGLNISSSIQEARGLTEKALAIDPKHLEALMANVALESIWAKEQWFSGADPQEAWELCFSSGALALQVDPNNIPLIVELSRAHLQCMVYRSRKGLSYCSEWEASVGLMERAVHNLPGSYELLRQLGDVYMEWAQQEFDHGKDPHPATEKATQILEQVTASVPSSARAWYGLAATCLIQGSYNLAVGKDPHPLLDKAIQAYARALTIKPDYRQAISDTAQCYLLEARFAIAKGDPPENYVFAARSQVDHICAVSLQRNFSEDLRLAECGMAELEWRLRSGMPVNDRASVLIAQIEGALQDSLRKNSDRDGWLTLAKFCELRSQFETTPAILNRGVEACRKAIALDRQHGESYLCLGALQARQATRLPAGVGRQRLLEASRSSLHGAAALNPILWKPAEQLLSKLD